MDNLWYSLPLNPTNDPSITNFFMFFSNLDNEISMGLVGYKMDFMNLQLREINGHL